MQTRRLIAAGVIVVIVIAIALLIQQLDASATLSSLKNYNATVYNLISRSDANGQTIFQLLERGNPTSDTLKFGDAVHTAQGLLQQAEQLHAPSQMAAAQTALVQVMQLRVQGMSKIADNVQQTANKNTSKDAVYNISLGTSKLYASDVLYKSFVTTALAKVLNANNIPIGSGSGEQQINAGQVVPDLGWLQSSWIADKIGAQQSTAQANANNVQPGLHGHVLNSVSVDGTTIYAGGTNTIPATSSQSWTLSVTNGGDYNEYHVGCSVQIVGLSDAGTSYIPETYAHQTSTCTVHLPSEPTPGTYSVVVSVAKVPLEKDVANNKITYSVTFS